MYVYIYIYIYICIWPRANTYTMSVSFTDTGMNDLKQTQAHIRVAFTSCCGSDAQC